MHDSQTTIGVMDIGSNSIRLAVYEVTAQKAYRLVYENKESARLSQKIRPDGSIAYQDIRSITPILVQFDAICRNYGCREVVVAATAAIRNAANQDEIVRVIHEQTGLTVTVLSGEQEAYYGFLGVVSTMDVNDGFIIDIGGGSSEITLFRDRKMMASISLPLGVVNGQEQFSNKGAWNEECVHALQEQIIQLLNEHPWIKSAPHLPLIGLGGTARTLGKMDQRRLDYALNVAHYYKIEGDSLSYYEELLPQLPLEKRKALDGLSKSRADIIVPGIIILNTIYTYIHAAHYVVSGTGLREGLLFEAERITLPAAGEVVPFQVKNILAFDNACSAVHLEFVQKTVKTLYQGIASSSTDSWENQSELTLLYAAAMLYQVGKNVRYHQYDKHTFYWLTHVPMIGLDHHKSLICACIASGMTPNKKAILPYKSLLQHDDYVQIERLGVLLQLAIALDVSVTQSIQLISASTGEENFYLELKLHKEAPLELRELDGLLKAFKKAWGLNLTVELDTSSIH